MTQGERRRCVAVLEDDEDLCEILCEVLRGSGVDAAGSSQVDRLNLGVEYDAYLLDWHVQGRTTESVVDAIRSAWPTVPIVVLSGNSPGCDAGLMNLIAKKAVVYMEKPVRMKKILDRLKYEWEEIAK